MTAFTASPSNVTVDLQWTNPNDATFSGTLIMAKIGSLPSGPADPTATLVVDDPAPIGSTRTFTHRGLTNGQHYYYTAYSYFQDAHRFYAGGTGANAVPALACDLTEMAMSTRRTSPICNSASASANIPIVNPSCFDANLDGPSDTDVDSADVSLFLGCFAGSDVYANPVCLP